VENLVLRQQLVPKLPWNPFNAKSLLTRNGAERVGRISFATVRILQERTAAGSDCAPEKSAAVARGCGFDFRQR
jgi:hypothetical protein